MLGLSALAAPNPPRQGSLLPHGAGSSEDEKRVFVATPAWHREQQSPELDSYSVPYWLHHHLEGHAQRTNDSASATHIYLAVYVKEDLLDDETNAKNDAWLRAGGSQLELADGQVLDSHG